MTAVLLLAAALPVLGQKAPLAADTAAIDACLRKQTKAPESCIGIIYKACTDQPSGETTMGMEACSQRETLVWQQKMAAALKQVLAGPLGKVQAQAPAGPSTAAMSGSDIISGMQSTWLTLLPKMCQAASLEYEGGTLAGVVYGQCIFQETGRHVLWLQTLSQDIH